MLNDDSPKKAGATSALAIPRIELPKFTLRGDSNSLFSQPARKPIASRPTSPIVQSTPAHRPLTAATTTIQTANPYLTQTVAAPAAPAAPAASQPTMPATRTHPKPTMSPGAGNNLQQPMPRPKRGKAVTPGKLGVLSVIAAFAMIIAQGNPAALRTNAGTASSLPSAPATNAPVGQASAAPQAPASGKKSPSKTKKSSVLPLTRGPAGMMSPSAAASISVERGGKAPKTMTDKVRMQGIPSPAAAATMAAKTLPLKADDGATMPATSERDSHAVDTHYGSTGSQTLGMEPMVERPVMTPGEAARRAELGVVEQSLQETTGSYAAPANTSAAAF